jgi:hypothetical protein
LIPLLLACSRSVEGTYDLPDGEPEGIETRFYGEQAFDPTAPQAFDLRERCPELDRVVVSEGGGDFYAYEVEGKGLDAVDRVGAVLPDGRLVAIQIVREDGKLGFPVGCEACEVVFGVLVDGRPAACTGPGRSLRVQAHRPG